MREPLRCRGTLVIVICLHIIAAFDASSRIQLNESDFPILVNIYHGAGKDPQVHLILDACGRFPPGATHTRETADLVADPASGTAA